MEPADIAGQTGGTNNNVKAAGLQQVVKNFSETLISRLEKDQLQADNKERKSPEEIQTLVENVNSAIEEVKAEFGQAAANQVMANIMMGRMKPWA